MARSVTVTYKKKTGSGTDTPPYGGVRLSIISDKIFYNLTIPITRVFCGTKAHRMHQIGSCIPPLFAKKLFRHIREHYLKYARAPEASASAAQARATGAHPTHQD